MMDEHRISISNLISDIEGDIFINDRQRIRLLKLLAAQASLAAEEVEMCFITEPEQE